MRLYKTYDTNKAVPPVWTPSSGAASKAKTAMTKALKDEAKPHRDVVFDAIEVPTKKDELIAFLNGPDAR